MSILVTGSLAIDHIMVFPDRFRNHILPDRLHILNVCFHVPRLQRHFGGTGGNIAYHLRLLDEDPILLAAAGEDFGAYAKWLDRHGIRRDWIRIFPGASTAQGFITTDLDDNQITAFHPGAMNHAHENHVDGALGAQLAIIAPDGKQGMLQHARECAAQRIPFMFDPGQGLPMFSAEELAEFVRLADYVAVNDYEGKMLEDKTGRRLEDLAREVRALIVTLGAQGSRIYAGQAQHEIPVAAAERVVDPTGCGDAYRAGLLYGIAQGWDWPRIGRLGAVLGAIKIASRGAQNHRADRATVEARYRESFRASPWD